MTPGRTHGERRGRRVWDSALRMWVDINAPRRSTLRRRTGEARSKQARRDEARAAGLCGSCCKRKPTPPFKTCVECREISAKAFRELHRLAGLARAHGLG